MRKHAYLFERNREHVVNNLFADIHAAKILHQLRPQLLDAAIVLAGILSTELAVELIGIVYAKAGRQ